MPLGLWKSKVEIYREENDRRHAEWREEMDRRHAEWHEEMDRRDAEWRASRAEQKQRDAEWQEERREQMDRLDRTIASFEATQERLCEKMDRNTEELVALRRDFVLMRVDLTDAVNSQTKAVFKLIDRFDQWEGRPPGPPDLRSV